MSDIKIKQPEFRYIFYASYIDKQNGKTSIGVVSGECIKEILDYYNHSVADYLLSISMYSGYSDDNGNLICQNDIVEFHGYSGELIVRYGACEGSYGFFLCDDNDNVVFSDFDGVVLKRRCTGNCLSANGYKGS